MPNKKYLEASGTMEVSGHVFSYKALKTTEAGFETLINNVKENEDSDDNATVFDVLSQLQQGETGLCIETRVNEKKTTPPALFTEATLLAALVHIADFIDDVHIKKQLKEKDKDKKDEQGGIGTPATRSEMLEILKRRHFMVVQKGKLIPTETGVTFFNALPEMATQPDMTALWAEQQNQIEQGNITVNDFITALMNFLTNQIKQVNVGDIKGEIKTEGKHPRLEVKCSHCDNEIVISQKVFSCVGCDFKIWATVADKKMNLHQIEKLILTGKTSEINGFISKKTGKPFSAKLVLQDKASGKIEFEFKERR